MDLAGVMDLADLADLADLVDPVDLVDLVDLVARVDLVGPVSRAPDSRPGTQDAGPRTPPRAYDAGPIPGPRAQYPTGHQGSGPRIQRLCRWRLATRLNFIPDVRQVGCKYVLSSQPSW